MISFSAKDVQSLGCNEARDGHTPIGIDYGHQPIRSGSYRLCSSDVWAALATRNGCQIYRRRERNRGAGGLAFDL